MAITPEEALARSYVWKMAEELIAPIVEKHGLEQYKTSHALVNSSTMTVVDQHIDQITRVADWLLNT